MLSNRILFVDAEAIVIDKPAGLPVDPPRRGGDSLTVRLDELKLGFARPPVPMHRLDQDTSGCLLLARNPKARSAFQRAFERGEVEKIYLALVEGSIDKSNGLIELPLVKRSSAREGWRMTVGDEGQEAATEWRRLTERDGLTLVEFRPLTGRTHQIRVHALEGLGAPVAGDPVYGSAKGPMMLHSRRLVVPRVKRPPIDVTAPVPPHFPDWANEG